MKKNLLIFFLIVLSIESYAGGKLGIPSIDYYNRRQYGGGTQNWKISQAPDGLIYFANNEGLLEYDGVNWRKLTFGNNPLCRSVLCDRNRIYVGGVNSVGCLSKNDSLQKIYRPWVEDTGAHAYDDFWDIHVLADQVAFYSHKALLLFEKDTLCEIITSSSRFSSSHFVDEMVLVNDEKEGLMELRNKKLFPVSGGRFFADKNISCILPLEPGRLLIGTMNHGLFVWDMDGFEPWNTPVSELLSRSNAFCAQPYGDDLIVFGTIQSGVVVSDKKGQIQMIIDKDKGLVNNTVLSVFVDREGSIWAGLDNGIARISYQTGMTFLQGYYGIGSGYAAVQKGQQYYLGTNQGLYVVDRDRFEAPDKSRDDFRRLEKSNGQVWTLQLIDDEVFCGHNLGAFKVGASGSPEWLTPADIHGVWLFRKVDQNRMVAGTYNGLILFEREKGRWVFRSRIAGFNESSRFLEWDDDGGLWISHGSKGLYKLYFSKDLKRVTSMLRYVDFVDQVGQGITVSRIGNRAVFCTKKGVFYYEKSINQFVELDYVNKLFINKIYPSFVSQDESKNIWFFLEGGMGVFRYQEDGSFKSVDSPFLAVKGRLVNGFEFVWSIDPVNALVGMEEGFAHYNSLSDRSYMALFSAHIRGLKSSADSLSYDIHSFEEQMVDINFPYRGNSVQFNLAAPFYSSPNLLFSTFLEGFEPDYSDWNSNTFREYSRLPEGNYVLRVKARNVFGVETPAASLAFTILPPFYRSLPAKVFYLFIFLLFIYLVFRFVRHRVSRLRYKEAMEQKARFEKEKSRLQQDTLTAEAEVIRIRNEKLLADIEYREKELANTTLHVVKKNEFLVNIRESLKKIKGDNRIENLNKSINILINKIDKDIDGNNHWDVFETHFEEVHRSFLNKLEEKHPGLSNRELKLCAFIRMGMTSKEIGALVNITPHAVENNRSRLRQKLGLSAGASLTEYIKDL